MQNTESLRVGYIPYLNCRPFFHHLATCGFSGEIISGVPSALNKMLQQGQLDLSPSSSFEYAQNSRDYLVLPDHSISAVGPVKSVLLFGPKRLADLQGQQIAITGESATSINLLRVLLREFVGLSQVSDAVPVRPVEELIVQGVPALLIGDRAMRQAANLPTGVYCHDLGELWYRYTHLPFVFALWILRRESARNKGAALTQLQDQLSCSIQQAFSNLDQLLINEEVSEFSAEDLVTYWQTIDYTLGPAHLKGLELFFQLCHKHGLLDAVPEVDFFQAG